MSKNEKKKKNVIQLTYRIFTDGQFLSAYRVLLNIRDPKDFKELKKVLDFVRKIDYHKDMYLEMLRKLQEDSGELNKMTNRYSYPDEETEKKVQERVDELLEVPFELDHTPVSLDDDILKRHTVSEILGIDRFFII